MTYSDALRLARRNLFSRLRPSMLSAFGVATGVASFIFFVSLGLGVSDAVRSRLLPADLTLIEARPAEVSLGAFLGGGALDDETVARMKTIDGVTDAFAKMEVRVPASIRFQGDFFGRPLRIVTELMANGIDPRLIERPDASPQRFVDPGPGRPIPVVANDRMLELYNKTFAPQRGLPRLSAQMLDGFRVPVSWGHSFVAAETIEGAEGQVELVDLSPHALALGVTMPLDAARRLNRTFGKSDRTYSGILLRARHADDVPRIAESVRRMGFDVDDAQQRIAEQVGFGVFIVTSAFALLSALIAALSAIQIGQSFHIAIRERRREIGVLRAVGASRADVMRVLLLEASLIGGVGGLVGIMAGSALATVTDRAAVRFVPDFPFKPDTFFVFPGWVFVAAFALALFSALVGASGPALAAARCEPAQAVAD